MPAYSRQPFDVAATQPLITTGYPPGRELANLAYELVLHC
jgi:hypothetical protein